MNAKITDAALSHAAAQGIDGFLTAVGNAVIESAGGEMTAESMSGLNSEQITLWGYLIMRDELMDGGFVQLIHNGYGPFFFNNPFAKAMRLWGLHDFSKVLYKARELYEKAKDDLTRECDDDTFMALFEQHQEFDALDDYFVENEEDITNEVAYYVDGHIDNFVEIIK